MQKLAYFLLVKALVVQTKSDYLVQTITKYAGKKISMFFQKL